MASKAGFEGSKNLHMDADLGQTVTDVQREQYSGNFKGKRSAWLVTVPLHGRILPKWLAMGMNCPGLSIDDKLNFILTALSNRPSRCPPILTSCNHSNIPNATCSLASLAYLRVTPQVPILRSPSHNTETKPPYC